MNRSYSKLRHIQELNQRFEDRTRQEKAFSQLSETFNVGGIKESVFDMLEKQRILEESLKRHNNLKHSFINEQEEDSEGEEDLTGIPDLESDEDFDAIIAYYPEEFDEYLRTTFKDFIGDEDESENLTESDQRLLIEANLLLERCPEYLGDCFKKWGRKFKRSKFARWWKRNIGEPTSDAMNKFGRKVKKGFRKFMKNVKDIDLNIEHKKRRKKGKNYKRKNSRKFKSLDKVWAKNKRGTIKIGRSGWINFGKGKKSASEEFSSEEELSPSIEPEEYATYLQENQNKMVSLMSKTSKSNWEKLKADPEEIAYAVAVLERFNETYEEKKWKRVGVGLDQETFRREVEADPDLKEDKKGEEKIYPTETFEFPLNPDNDKNLFVDNHWEESYAQVFLSEVKALCELIKTQMAGLTPPEGKPKAYLESMWLQASASRFRNGGDAANLSFQELSQKRLETGKAILLRELGAIGVVTDGNTAFNFDTAANKSELNPNGNGDGSSGPNPPKGFGFIAKGNFKMSPNCGGSVDTCPINGKNVSRSECGTPHASKAEYEKYKFINGSVKLVFNDDYKQEPVETPPDEDKKEFKPDVEVITTKKYPIYFYAPGRKPFRIPIPALRIKWKKLFTFKRRSRPTYGPPAGKKNGATKCEAFGG